MFTLISAGIAPGIALMSFFYLKDKYEPEPILMVVRTFLFGILLVFPVMVLQFGIHEEMLIPDWVDAFFVSSLLEEFLKWFLLYFAAYQQIEFNDPYDGIIYGASISLGFATAENVLFLFANGIETAMLRAFLPVQCHALFGVMMGYYLSRAKFTDSFKMKRKYIIYSLFIPILYHGLYDYIILYHIKRWIYIMFPFMLFLWWLGLRKVKHAQHASKNIYSNK
ncbi:glutamic-type intramembrane protease PrsW [Alkalihalobacillus sp. AL-G]|uniref:glutamic-type intramembrane protease PrsW n=1 Tax=Alkalihalobacillus sp. AL-G TaxID=2926399 RepID=UPI00272B7187|nr:glutamic-type intramembrane protease PrsW [Alkalihalobacillus sp. AL-G]WLD91850.1 glutamic-type intramembrane protease PrsW [Alkalihalobacillus sp. AL-G]